jgi:hypothetical protein
MSGPRRRPHALLGSLVIHANSRTTTHVNCSPIFPARFSFHVTPSQLRRGFAREFGLSIHEYQQQVRVKAAIEHVRKGNMEATALGVGYKGKKNFYHAFRLVTGVTPTTIRRLSEERARHVIESIGAAPPRRAVAADRRRGNPIV